MFKLRAVITCRVVRMELLLLVWRQYRWPFISVMALSLASAALGIGLIAFINQRLIETVDTTLMVLPEFLGLLLLLMVVTLGSQLALTTLGHHFVYRLRSEFIKRILDTHVERIEQLGSASLLAGLTSDIRNITIAFVRLPELVQGIILTIGSAAYLAMLSTKMLLVTAIWMAITIWGDLCWWRGCISTWLPCAKQKTSCTTIIRRCWKGAKS